MLDLQYNQLKFLPSSLGSLKCLTTLHLKYNQIETIPAEIGNLTELEEIDFEGNRLSTLPGIESNNIDDFASNFVSQI